MLSSREPGCSHICKDAYFKYGPILQLRVDYLMGAPLNPLQVYSSTGAPLRGGDSLARTKRIRGSRAEDQAYPDVPALPHSVVGQTAPLLRQAAHGSDGESETLPAADRGTGSSAGRAPRVLHLGVRRRLGQGANQRKGP